MPGLDESDLIAFLRVIDAPRPDITVRAAGFIETVQGKIKGYEAHIAAVPEDRLRHPEPKLAAPLPSCRENVEASAYGPINPRLPSG
jgi:hypothetical protein